MAHAVRKDEHPAFPRRDKRHDRSVGDVGRKLEKDFEQKPAPCFDGAIVKIVEVGGTKYEFRFRPTGVVFPPCESGEKIVEHKEGLPLRELKEELDAIARKRGFGHVLNLAVE